MQKTSKLQTFIPVAAFMVLMILSVFFSMHAKPAEGSTLAFAVPKVATSSLVTVGPQNVVTIAATSSNCVSRVIGTVGTAIQTSFSQSINPSGTVGNPQGASTTVVYNNGDYGCGAITGFAAASTSITITTLTQ